MAIKKNQTKRQQGKAASKAALAAVAGAVALSSEANAAEANAEQMTNLESLNNVASLRRLEDGSLEITLENGEVVILGADDFVEQADQFLVDADALAATGATGNLILLGLAAAAVVGGGIAAASGGGDDGDPVELINVPSAAADSLIGTQGADIIDGLGGDDIIDGLGGGDTLIGNEGNDTLIGGTGADTLLGGTGNDSLNGGAGNDILAGGTGTDIIDGGEGVDTNSFEGIGLGVVANVNADGTGTAAYGQVNETFTGIENLTGSDNDDVLTATGAASNTIIGGLGDDFISGGGGSDITDGGAGIDTVSFADIGPAVVVSVDETGTGTAQYSPADGVNIVDTLANFEIIEAREGGEDTIDLSSFTTGVRVDLDTNTPQPGPASQNGVVQVDGADVLTLTDFENIVGTDFDDVLLGNNEINVIDGGAGNDAIHSFGGADIVDGGEGVDTLLLTATPVGTVVTLDDTGSGVVQIGGNDADVFSNFENVSGSNAGDDVLTGNQVDNVLNGNGGDDVLTGGLGNDTLVGGDGIDTADFSDIDVPVTITVDADGNGTAVRETGFAVSVVDAEVATLNGLSDADFVSEAVAGNIYFNVHTSDFGGGEIRGQIDTIVSDVTDADGVRTIVLTGDLDASQEPGPTSDSLATGTSTTTIVVAADGSVTYSTELNITGLATSDLISLGAVSAIHLHNAPAGVNGPVVQDVIVDAGNPSGPALPFSITQPVTETDTLESIEEFILSDDNDVFTATGAASQTVDGGAGDDIIAGGGGTDFLDGGEGNDTNSFEGIGFGVTASLLDGTAAYGPVNETFVNFENLLGSANDDSLTGDNEDNVLTGAAGADTLIGLAGDDTLVADLDDVLIDGGEGIDTLDLSALTEGVRVDLDVNTPNPGPASQDGVIGQAADGIALVDIENIIGTQGDDVLLGNNEINVIEGGAGNDAIHSFGGVDTIDGGEGIDTALFSAGPGVIVELDEDGSGQAFVNEAGVAGAESDIFLNFENVNGSVAGDDVLTGNQVDNVLNGQGGDDVLTGGLGNDTLVGGDGIDTADFSDIDVPVTITVDADGNGTAVRETGFAVSVDNVAVDTLNGLSDADFVSEAVAGNIYFNVHTADFNGGEIRGQIDTIVSDVTDADGVRTIVLTGDLDASQEPGPTSDSEATGTSTTTIVVAADGSVTYSTELNITGLATSDLISLGAVSAIHLHNAPAGTNGPVVQDVIVDAGNPTGPALPFSITQPVVETDTLTSIEEFILSDDNDVFTATGAASQTVDGGAGDDIIAGGGGTDFLDGGEGNDTNSFEGIGFGVVANVNADGTGTAAYGPVNETFVNFENLTGSDNDDVLTATGAASNTLIGGLGDDFISGGGGSDITDGGEGNDTVSFADIGPAVAVSVDQLGNGTAVYSPAPGVEIVDTLASFENFVARDGGEDTIDLSAFTEGVRVDLDINTPAPGPISQDGVVQTFDANGDPVGLFTLTDFENIVGTDFDDVLLGNQDINIIDGGAGNDAIHSFGGADIVDGGEGIDTLLLTATPVGTVVTLDATGSGVVQINGNDADVFSNFENVSGSNAGDDVLTGNQVDNVLNGNGGDDILTGAAGDDTINGGAGNDTATFADLAADITAVTNADGTITVTTATEGVDILTDVEVLLDGAGDAIVVAPASAAPATTTAPAAAPASVFTSLTTADEAPVSFEDQDQDIFLAADITVSFETENLGFDEDGTNVFVADVFEVA